MLTKSALEKREKKRQEMARGRRKENDPPTREDKRRRQQEESGTSSSDSEDEQVEVVAVKPKAKPSTNRTDSTPKSTKSKNSDKRRSSSSTPATHVSTSSRGTDSDQDDGVSLAESVDSRPSASRSPTSRRVTASSAEQIADLQAKVKAVKMATSKAQKKLEKKLAEMKKQLDAAEQARDQFQQEKDDAEGKLDNMRRMKDDLREKLKSSYAKKGGVKSTKAKNAGMIMQIKKVSKKDLWRICKIIVNDKQLAVAANMVCDHLRIKDYVHLDSETEERRDQVDDAREEWLDMYSTDVRAAINEQRSYVQSEMKKIALLWLKQGNPLLPFDDFKAIALRNLDGDGDETDPEKEKQFDLYLTFLSAVAGSSTYGDKQRRTEPVSTCMTKDGKTAVPAGTEAMCLIMYDNCYQKWLNMHDYKEVKNLSGDIPKYSSKRHEETKQWMGKYSDSCSGNSPYGGWSSAGIKAFNTLKKEIYELREEQLADILPIEKAAVERFAKAYQEERKRKHAANGKQSGEDQDGSDSETTSKRRRVEKVPEELVVDFDE